MNKEQRRVTVRDVARLAGVSPATASRALSGSVPVSAELQRKVLRASAELGWSANALARALRTQRTDTIGIVVPAVNNPYFMAVVDVLEAELAASDRSLIVCDSRDSAEIEARRIDLLVSRMVDGLVVVPSSGAESLPALKRASDRVPTVLVDRWVEGAGLDFVGADNAEGMRLVVEHLTDAGVRSVAFVGARTTTSTAAGRLAAFREQADQHQLRVVAEELGEYSFAWGETAARRLLAGELPDAVVCGADIVACGVLNLLHQAGVPVPGRLRVAGFDDLPLDQITYPPLTSVRQAMAEQAHEALRLLDARAEDPSRPSSRSVFAPSLVVRESSPKGGTA